MLKKLSPAWISLVLLLCSAPVLAADRPNIIYILCDNLGYGDIGCYGSTLHRTPHVDQLAKEGIKLTSFYVSSGVCTPSRASIMTGCYPRRVNMQKSDLGGLVLQPVSPKGLHPNEVTIAEVLKSAGYATTIIGKWHLGDQPELLPTRQGFDSFFGIPYSDDMTPREGKPWPPLPLMKDEKVIDSGVDRDFLTKRYTEVAVEFIEEHQDQPFFLYLPHAMPGSTRSPFASPEFLGKSQNGSYGDSVEELDWSTGEIMAALKRLKIDDNTIVIWTSDNGAPRRNPPQGSNAPLKGWGYDVSEGAMRVPCLIRWPGKISPATCDTLCCTMDLYPTLAHLAGAKIPTDVVIDGKDIWPILSTPNEASSPHEAYYYYFGDQLQAVRSGPWKLYLPNPERLVNSRKTTDQPAELYNLDQDIHEDKNVAADHEDVVKRLVSLAEKARIDLGDVDVKGKGQREAGWFPNPVPLLP